MSEIIVKCACCGKKPEELAEYRDIAKVEGYTSAEEAVRREEGTYNPRNGHFYCTACYIKKGMPLGVAE